MNAFLAVILLGQVGGETSISDSFRDNFSKQPPAVIEPREDEIAASPPADEPAVIRQPTRAVLTADSPPARSRLSQAIAGSATPRAVAQPTQQPANTEAQYATTLLGNLLTLDEESQSKYRKTKLVEAVSRSMDVQAQALAIGAYWDLAMHIGRLRFAQDKVALLTSLPGQNDPVERALLDSAVATALANEAAAHDELMAAQYRLVRTSGISAEGTLPWPADMPLVSAYRTNYETFFAQRPAPLEIRHIHQSLPGKLRLIERCVTAVSAAENAKDALLQNYSQGQGRTSVTPLLESTERLEKARHAFLAAVVDYNDRIAEYSLAAVGPSIGPETLVTTLIKAPASATNMASVPRDVRQATIETAPGVNVGPFR
jgi:hypothetical protein